MKQNSKTGRAFKFICSGVEETSNHIKISFYTSKNENDLGHAVLFISKVETERTKITFKKGEEYYLDFTPVETVERV